MDVSTKFKKAGDGVLLLHQTRTHWHSSSKHLTEEKVIKLTERKMRFPNVVLLLASAFVIVLAAPQAPHVSIQFFHYYYIYISDHHTPSPRTMRLDIMSVI